MEVDPLKRAGRAIDKAVLKIDHFEAIYRLEKKIEGVPNFRRVEGGAAGGAAGGGSGSGAAAAAEAKGAGAGAGGGLAIYGSGQPSVSGFVSVLGEILNGGALAGAAEGEEIHKVM